MSIYLLHQDPADQNGEHLVCLRDRFNWFAAILPPVWAIVHGLWRVLIIMVAIGVALIGLKLVIEFPFWLVYVALAWWLGFEADHLHSRSLTKKGWGEGTDIIAFDAQLAEQAFLSRREVPDTGTPSDA